MKTLVHISFLDGTAVGPLEHDNDDYDIFGTTLMFYNEDSFQPAKHYPLSSIKEICIKPVHSDRDTESPTADAPMQQQKLVSEPTEQSEKEQTA